MLALNQLVWLLHLLVGAERGPVHFISFPIAVLSQLADHPYKKFCGLHWSFTVSHSTV